ncbi:MAG: hypothetical protein ABI871_01355 [Chthoniobacterales bacterium]
MEKQGISGRSESARAIPELKGDSLPPYSRGATHAAIATATIAGLVLIGWYWDIEVLKRIAPGLVAMNPMTAVTFLIAASCLGNFAGHKRQLHAARSLRVGRVCALLVGLVGAVQLIGIVSGHDLHFDRWLFRAKIAADGESNTIAPNMAFNFLLIGSALFFLPARNRRLSAAACVFAFISGFEAILVILGFSFLCASSDPRRTKHDHEDQCSESKSL